MVLIWQKGFCFNLFDSTLALCQFVVLTTSQITLERFPTVYPSCEGSVPQILKGWFEQIHHPQMELWEFCWITYHPPPLDWYLSKWLHILKIPFFKWIYQGKKRHKNSLRISFLQKNLCRKKDASLETQLFVVFFPRLFIPNPSKKSPAFSFGSLNLDFGTRGLLHESKAVRPSWANGRFGFHRDPLPLMVRKSDPNPPGWEVLLVSFD